MDTRVEFKWLVKLSRKRERAQISRTLGRGDIAIKNDSVYALVYPFFAPAMTRTAYTISPTA